MNNTEKLRIDKYSEFQSLPGGYEEFRTASDFAAFHRKPDSFSWISDVEHIIYSENGEKYLADGDPAFYFCGATIPGCSFFELFPYHYYDKKEEEILGKKIHYSLIAKNINSVEVILEIDGQGTTRDWDHFKTWRGALSGKHKRMIRIPPGKSVTLWTEKDLDGDLPWSGVILGYASADVWVCDYAWTGEMDPGAENARPMPDLSLPPIEWPSFTRGTATWNAADVDFFPNARTAGGKIPLGKMNNGVYSLAIAEAPGGPENKPQLYAARERSFPSDQLPVLDPVSQKSHLYFGGNYPVMYNFRIPLANEGDKSRRVSFNISSNDTWNVDSIIGAWINGEMLWKRVPDVDRNLYWSLWEIDLEPGETEEVDFILVPLGSRWGGMIASLAITYK